MKIEITCKMSDDEDQYNPKAHKGLLQAISSLGKTQHIRKSTRSEPKRQQDEFQLVKTSADLSSERAQPVVEVNDIVQLLKHTKNHIDAGKKYRNVQKTRKVLAKPLEKPTADRLKRRIGYENVKNKLSRWDAIVAKNRSAETQVFPLKSETIYVNTSAQSKPLPVSVKSELRLEMEATEARLKALQKERMGDHEDENELKKREKELLEKNLTREEIIAKRKELAYLKMRESQKSAKARLKNKIKSKTYHKLLKRQKIQEQMKEFEILQKTNPEAALEKLDALEKSRVLERASLRHKNTGTWAKNLQVRAKYDKDVRKDLAEQLQISRQITQKKTNDDSDEDQVEDVTKKTLELEKDETYDPFNPWTRTTSSNSSEKPDETNEKENWRKYWLKRNEDKKQLEDYREGITKNTLPLDDKITKNAKTKKNNVKEGTSKEVKIENGWVVEKLDPTKRVKLRDQTIDDIFDAQEEKIRDKLSNKMKRLAKESKLHLKLKDKKEPKPIKKKKKKDQLANLKNLSFKNDIKRPIIDEALMHEDANDNIENLAIQKLKEASKNSTKDAEKDKTTISAVEAAIDPNIVAPVKLKQNINSLATLGAYIGDADIDEEEEYDKTNMDQQITISQAFEDDDIIADFTKDKTQDSELKNAEIELSMPGWGSWAGAGISKEHTNKSKRLILKLAPKEQRRDENKNRLYINEEASKHLRTHLVSDVPFPFTSLKSFESSIRAPIGRNFVPETAFRMLTRPAVITHKGQIIEPMDESELMKKPRRLRHVVDQRIERAAVATAKKMPSKDVVTAVM